MNSDRGELLERAQDILGVRFQRLELLESALTHPSAAEGKGAGASYERLEFLGDSVLGAIVALRVYDAYPQADEGKLTRTKVALVAGSTLSQVAGDLGLAEVLILGSSELGTKGRGVPSALENVYEAVVAAIYLDQGAQEAADFIDRTLMPLMNDHLNVISVNPKSALQEKLQVSGITPAYRLVEQIGPPHDRIFVAEVLAGDVILGQGEGRSKKEAESKAAEQALKSGEFPTTRQNRKTGGHVSEKSES